MDFDGFERTAMYWASFRKPRVKEASKERGDTTTKVAELLQWSAVGNREQRSESRRKHFDDKANPTKLDCWSYELTKKNKYCAWLKSPKNVVLPNILQALRAFQILELWLNKYALLIRKFLFQQLSFSTSWLADK